MFKALAALCALLMLQATSALAQAQPTNAKPAVDPAVHAAHVVAGTHPAPTNPPPDTAALVQQVSELRAKAAQLEAALARNNLRPSAAATPLAAMPGMAAPAAPMAGMSGSAPGAMTPAGRMGGMAAPPGGAMNMMGMMDKMMGMMDKMMSMGGGAMPAGAPMAGGGMGMMDMDDKMEMGGMGAMPAGAPAAGMSGGGMGMDKMEMAGMMGMGAMSSGAAGAMPQSVLPGFPGASHLYHIGATDFFLDHPQHIALATEQRAALNRAKEQALLAKSTADRAVAQAEQELWTLTAADQPDAKAIAAKIAEIGKLAGDARMSFIRAVGDASKILTDEQRKILTGFAPPVSAAPMAGGMKGM
jgi:hypothetical protein